MIDRETVNRIMDAAQIVDVVSDFVTLHKAGANFKGLCPFHNERTPSFVVSPAKNYCKCFACGKGGNPVHFIMEHEQMTFPEALRYLAKKYNIEIKERELTDKERQAESERESLFIVNEWACSYFEDQLYNSVDGQAIGMTYFHSRAFRNDTIKKFRLGYCPSQKNAMASAAKLQGYKDEYLEKTGVCYRKDDGRMQDRFWGRVIFPVFTLSGKVVAFGGRVLDAATKGVKVKYVNSPESTIYNKSAELYGLFQAKQAIVRQDRCFLVEGYTDVISMHQSGIENVVASSGTSLTPGQIRLIHRFTDNITILYDGDEAGIHASLRGIDMLLEEGMNVKVLLLPDGDDPDSFARKHNATEYQAYIEANQVDFIRFKTNLLLKDAGNDPIRRAGLINNIVKSIAVIPDDIICSVYVHECSEAMEVDEKLLVDAVGKLKRAAAEERTKRRLAAQNRTQYPAAPLPYSRQPLPSAPSAEATAPESTFIPPVLPEYEAPVEGGAAAAAEVAPSADATAIPLPVDVPPEASAIVQQPVPPASPAQPAPYQQTSFIPRQNVEEMMFYQKELLLMSLLVRYGERTACMVEDEEGKEVPLTVGEFIDADLKRDSITFHVPLHIRMLEEFMEHKDDAGFKAEYYFCNHIDPAVSQLAFELSTDRYQLSKIHTKFQKVVRDEDRLYELATHLMADFKYAVVCEEEKQTLLALRKPENINDEKRYMEIMKHYQDLNRIKQIICKALGDRVVI